MNLAELRQQLEAQIREGQLPEALQSLLSQVPDSSETYKIVSALIARLNAANKERYRNTISFEEYQRRVDQVSADFFDMIAGLTETDFEAAQGPAKAGKKGKQGSVLYHVPQTMRLQIPTRCTIRVAVNEDEMLENIVLDKFLKVKNEVEISDVMSAELVDPEGGVFKISTLNARTQLVRDTGYTEWNFNVTPLIEGVHQLLVKVSILEVVPGFSEPIPRDVSLLETVTIVTESTTIQSDSPGAPQSDPSTQTFKPTGQTFGFQSPSTATQEIEISYAKSADPMAPPATLPQASRSSNTALKPLALFLGFLILVPAATWAITPPATLDWWIASIKDSPEAYSNYITTYQKSNSPYLEKAYFFKAEKSDRLADLRAYQDKYQVSGRYSARVISKVAQYERKSVEDIQQQPNVSKIRQFAADFPESEHLNELKQAVENRTENRQELLAEVENAYVTAVKTKPSEVSVSNYLREFPNPTRLNEVEAAVRSKPEVFSKVQPLLEDAYLKKMEQNPTQSQSEQFLEKFPEPVRREKFEKILEQKPSLKQAAATKMKRLEAIKAAKRGQ